MIKFTIQQKLICMVILMTISLIASNMISLFFIRQNDQKILELNHKILPLSTLTGETSALFHRNTEDVEVAISLGEPHIFLENKSIHNTMLENLRKIQELNENPDLAKVLPEIVSHLGIYRKIAEEFVTEATNSSTPRVLLIESGKKIQYEQTIIKEKLAEIQRITSQLLSDILAHSQTSSRRSAGFSSLFALLLIVIITIGSYLIGKSVLSRIKLLAKHFETADLDRLSPLGLPPAGDELDGFLRASDLMLENFRNSRSDLVEKNLVDNILASLTDMLIVVDVDGKIQKFNTATTKLLSVDEHELKTWNLQEKIICKDKSGQNFHQPNIDSLIAAAQYLVDAEIQSCKGILIPIMISAAPLIDKFGHNIGTVLSLKDITAIRNSEAQTKAMEAQLAQASKLAAIGTLGAGVAHELNNPLVAVKGYAEILMKKFKDMDDVTKPLERIVQASIRMKKITDRLRSFATDTSKIEMHPMEIKEPIQNSLVLLEQQLARELIDVQLHIPDDLPKILGEELDLESVFQNLFSNSLYAFSHHPEIKQREITIKAHFDSHNITIIYRDNAGGIPEKVREKIFDAFFTTKPVGSGTGLGLSISHQAIIRHKGTLELAPSSPGTTEFKIVIPVIEPLLSTYTHNKEINSIPTGPALNLVSKSEGEHQSKNSAETSNKNEISDVKPISVNPTQSHNSTHSKPHALIVDDDELVLEILVTFLSHDFEIQSFSDPQEAISQIQQKTYDIILTDMRMPKISGADIAEKARKFQPQTPVLIITGHAYIGEERAELLKRGVADIIAKPLPNRTELIALVKSYLNQPHRAKLA